MNKNEEAAIKQKFKREVALLKSQMKGKKIKMDCEKIICERLEDAKAALKNGHNEQAEFDAALISVVLGLCEKYEQPHTTISKMETVGGITYADMCHDEL